MRRIAGVLTALTLVASAVFADEKSDHLEHLRAMLAEMSQHGPVIPQPEAINAQASVTIAISAHATPSFGFTPNSFSVNQGDVVTISLSVAANDGSQVNDPAHALLMDTYVEQPLDCRKGQTVTRTFTATTAGTFPFVCNQPSCGEGHTSMFGQMVVNAVTNPGPTVTGISPNSGPPAGGTPVIITGTNFQTTGTTIVRFDTTPATNVSVTSSTTISAVTPAHPEQTVGVRVTNPDGQIGTLPMGFTFAIPGPRITGVSPTTGSTAGGTSITISGSQFETGATVTIGGIAATNVNVANANTITATTPLGPANEQISQPVDVVVTNPDGLSATLSRAFTFFVPPLTVIAISPAFGVTGGGTVVTVTGTGFTTAVTSSVTFGGVPATNVSVIDAVTMQATAPAHAAGTVDMVVTVGGLSVTKTGAFTFQAARPRHRAAHH